MSRFSIDVLPPAEREFREAFLWYFDRSPLATDAFRTEVMAAIDALAEDADMWPKNEDGIHYRVLSKFPYASYFDMAGQQVTVLAIAHQRRQPRNWQER